MKITAIIPTYNEEQNIEAALASVSFCDEILVVDSFSTDGTLDIARKYNARIIQREYENSASQKNWAIPQATYEWIVLLDADEVITNNLKKEILATVVNKPKEVAFWIYRSNDFMGQRLKYSGYQDDKVIRLFKRDNCRYEAKHVHAEVIAEGKVGYLKHKIEHDTYKGFDHYIDKLNRYSWWQAHDYQNRTGLLTPYHFVIKPIFRFFKHYIIGKGFLDGLPGFTMSCLQAYAVFSRYVKIWLIRKGVNK